MFLLASLPCFLLLIFLMCKWSEWMKKISERLLRKFFFSVAENSDPYEMYRILYA